MRGLVPVRRGGHCTDHQPYYFGARYHASPQREKATVSFR